jgi:hypothetical protein
VAISPAAMLRRKRKENCQKPAKTGQGFGNFIVTFFYLFVHKLHQSSCWINDSDVPLPWRMISKTLPWWII